MSLTNPNKIVTEERLSDFYNTILPYLGGNDANSIPYDNTDSGLTSENVQDAIDELNESKASPLTSAEMTAIKNAFDATNTSKFATTYTKYSTEEQVVGEWIDGNPIYQRTYTNLSFTAPISDWGSTGIDATNCIPVSCLAYAGGSDNFCSNLNIRNKNNEWHVMTSSNVRMSTFTILTVQYTKTTD